MAQTSPAPSTCPSCGRGVTVLGPGTFANNDGQVIRWKDEHYVPLKRLRLAHQARRAKEHQLDDVRRALCDIGFMEDDAPYSHADLADVIRQNGRSLTDQPAADDEQSDAVDPNRSGYPITSPEWRPGEGHDRCTFRLSTGDGRLQCTFRAGHPPHGHSVNAKNPGTPEPDHAATEATEPERCCVCGGGPVTYHNHREQPFCWPCADCGCNQDVCVRTGINDPAVSQAAAQRGQLASTLADVLAAFSPVSSHTGTRLGWTTRLPVAEADYSRWSAALRPGNDEEPAEGGA